VGVCSNVEQSRDLVPAKPQPGELRDREVLVPDGVMLEDREKAKDLQAGKEKKEKNTGDDREKAAGRPRVAQ